MKSHKQSSAFAVYYQCPGLPLDCILGQFTLDPSLHLRLRVVNTTLTSLLCFLCQAVEMTQGGHSLLQAWTESVSVWMSGWFVRRDV